MFARLFSFYTLTLVTLITLSSFNVSLAGPGPGPGPGPTGGGSSGPPDPPRDTPGLDPITLTAIAAGGYAGYQAFKNRPNKK